MKYYIGIDGGGTKTQYALFNENKDMLLTVKTQGSNHENLDGAIPQAADILMSGINMLLDEKGLKMSDIEHILMALSGMDHPFQCDEMTEELKKRSLTAPFSIYNDGFIVVKAGATSKEGIGYNCGTGTCCNSVGSDGKLLQIGGFGLLSGDVGNGHWIAERTFQAVYNDICLKMCSTVCTQKFVQKFGICADRTGLLSLIPDIDNSEEQLIRDLIDIFFEALAENDAAAVEIADVMAVRGAQFITAHIRNQVFDCETIDVVLSGSIHTKLPSDIYIGMLKRRTEELSSRKCNFIKLSAAPVIGCINWMLEK